MNFRPDRAREITRTFVDPDFTGFERKKGFFHVNYVCTTSYDATMPNVEIAFPKQKLNRIFGEYISDLGLTQLRIAETEKYAHVTFFFNGGAEKVFPGEDRCLIASPKVATYDLKPDMSANEVAAACVERIESGKYDVTDYRRPRQLRADAPRGRRLPHDRSHHQPGALLHRRRRRQTEKRPSVRHRSHHAGSHGPGEAC